ncbi:MAG: D-sedoheptulose 7-phosphate isomerase [Methylotetracoccus sp.]|nr:D-sedoheptulose 7-phosphate isomerase [Methylotetracoccus sp.]
MPESSLFSHSYREHLRVVNALESLEPAIESLGARLVQCLRSGGKILWMGNGGSAADSQHLASEIVGRFQRDRPGLPSIALTTDSSLLTSVGNDYGFDRIFSRQIESLCRSGDVVVGISTSGNSGNVVAAIEAARQTGAYTVGFTGEGGGRLAQLVDALIAVPSRSTPRIQECHIMLGHILCEYIDAAA